MKLIEVESNNLEKIGYDEEKSIVHVVFKKGTSTYKYHDVPVYVWNAFLTSHSKGVFLENHIKGIYRFSK